MEKKRGRVREEGGNRKVIIREKKKREKGIRREGNRKKES